MTDNAIRQATAIAHPNIALIKYWGKAENTTANEPAVSSLSITLDELATRTTLTFNNAYETDRLTLNGSADTAKLPRISSALSVMRELAGITTPCHIDTSNNFPTGAGLASSASGFAALVVAANHALDLNLSLQQQTKLARAMSGSAARSLLGGFAKIYLPHAEIEPAPFGANYAEAVAPADHWPLEVCVGVVSEEEKAIGSTAGMENSRLTSPYYSAWIAGNDADVINAETLVQARDFDKLAELSEFSCLKMHALALASRPALLYWSGATMDAMRAIQRWRAEGTPVFFTIDAGPQIKAICAPGYGELVAQRLSELAGIKRVIRCKLGQGARLLD